MHKKIVNEIALGIILLVALVVGGIFWLGHVKELAVLSGGKKGNTPIESKQSGDNQNVVAENSCKVRYYEGKETINGWFVSEDENGIIIAMDKSETANLPPIVAAQATDNENNFTVKLIDSTDEIKAKIKAFSQKKPTGITIQGYAEICQKPPLVSIQPVTEAFKTVSFKKS